MPDPSLRSASPLLALVVLVLVPGLTLAYLGLRGVAAREAGLRTQYLATATLVRDRLAAELARREDALTQHGAQQLRDLEDPDAAQRWLASLQRDASWLEHPFLAMGEGVATGAVRLNWPRQIDDPLSGLAAASSLVSSAEAAEFVRGDLENALRLYRTALDRTSEQPRARAFVRTRIGRTLVKLHRLPDAIGVYRQVVIEAGPAIDRHGLPFAVIALVQIADASDSIGRKDEAAEAERSLLAYVVDHPWDVADGYGVYLNRALSSQTADDAMLKARARTLAADVARIEWLQRDIKARIESLPGRHAAPASANGHLAGEREGQRVLIGYRQIPPEGSIRVGYQVKVDALTGEMLGGIRAAIEIEPAVRVEVIGGSASPGRAAAANGHEPLGLVPFLGDAPGWDVVLVDTRGRSVRQIVALEQWTYGAIVAGMLAVMMVGLLLAARASARASELARLKTQFVANVSHELRTPLSLIRMFGETLESGLVSDESKQREFAAVIRRESERLTHLINNVLDLGKIEAGSKQYAFERSDLVETVRQALAAYRPLFDRLGFVIDHDLPAASIELPLDRDAIVQALVNLFQNVIKYSDERTYVRVAVTIAGGLAQISVTDRGVGIAASEVTRIFEPYYRAASASGRSGSGLGLSIVRHAVAAHGGRVDVESTAGAGSTFTIVLPIAGASSSSARDYMRTAGAGA